MVLVFLFNLLISLYCHAFMHYFLDCSAGSQVPHLLLPEDLDPKMILLRKEYAWHIGGALSHQELGEWRLLYHSAVHGLSFSTFLGKIS